MNSAGMDGLEQELTGLSPKIDQFPSQQHGSTLDHTPGLSRKRGRNFSLHFPLTLPRDMAYLPGCSGH